MSQQPTNPQMKERLILVLRQPIRDKIVDAIKSIPPQIQKSVYVQFCPQLKAEEYLKIVATFYSVATQYRPSVDVRLLLGKHAFGESHAHHDGSDLLEEEKNVPPFNKKYKNVVLGGTFDRIHNGHKVLLSSAILLASDRITCGVTDGDMIKSKKLWELIQPVEDRIKGVKEFINDVSDGLRFNVVPIVDPFGPSIIEDDLECIIVSNETKKGGDAVNKRRIERGLSELDLFVISVIEGEDKLMNEVKLSSSGRRRQLLGHLLRPPLEPQIDVGNKYLIGLTGGICSGKTHISAFMERNGCFVIDCDKVGHWVLDNSDKVRNDIKAAFGEQTVIGTTIDRKALGAFVFKDKKRLEKLQEIMWPIMEDRVLGLIKQTDEKIVVIDAAVLFEANWDRFVHEVWTAMVPMEFVVERVMNRDNLTKELAEDRIRSQMKTEERVKRSHVVLCSQWEYEETNRQVLLALEHVKKRFS